MDFVVVGQNSSIRTSGVGSSALFVATNGQLGGVFDDTTPITGGSTATLEISRAESDTVIEIAGNMTSSEGRGITIAGTATGVLHVTSTGTLAGEGGGADGAALVIDGTYTGTHLNEGSIQNGIFITGTHTANSGAAYHASGNSTLTGCYTTVNGGISEAVNDHAVYLEGNSKTDFIVALGRGDGGENSRIQTLAANKSAIYVSNGAQLGGYGGRTAADAAILVEDGGIIGAYDPDDGDDATPLTPSSTGSAITVVGDFIGKVKVDNGSIISGEGSYAVNFSNANDPLYFEQTGDEAETRGIISASPQHKVTLLLFMAGPSEGMRSRILITWLSVPQFRV